MIPEQAVAEEHLVVGAVGMMTTEEAGASVKTDMTDVMIRHGAPEIILRKLIRSDARGPPQRPKLNLKPQNTSVEDDSSGSKHLSVQSSSLYLWRGKAC